MLLDDDNSQTAVPNTPEQDDLVQKLMRNDDWRGHVEALAKHTIHLCRLESLHVLGNENLAWQLSVAMSSSVLANILVGCRAVPDRVIQEQATMLCKMLLHAVERRHDVERSLDRGESYTIDNDVLERTTVN